MTYEQFEKFATVLLAMHRQGDFVFRTLFVSAYALMRAGLLDASYMQKFIAGSKHGDAIRAAGRDIMVELKDAIFLG